MFFRSTSAGGALGLLESSVTVSPTWTALSSDSTVIVTGWPGCGHSGEWVQRTARPPTAPGSSTSTRKLSSADSLSSPLEKSEAPQPPLTSPVTEQGTRPTVRSTGKSPPEVRSHSSSPKFRKLS